MAKGCHALIRQGAKLVETATDILEELGPLAATVTSSQTRSVGDMAADSMAADIKNEPLMLPELDQEYRDLLGYLQEQPLAIDVLVERSGLTAEAVSSMLLILELQGYVTAFPGGLYSRSSLERS